MHDDSGSIIATHGHEEKEMIEQWVPGYGPQAAAMHTLPHAAHLSSTARGPIQNPDVR